jgi:hypothetical protein
METKAISSIDRHVYKDYVLNKVLPAIMERWPKQEKKNPIYIQEDNCRIHTTNTRVEVKKAAKKKGFKIEVRPQPASSPDFNILDLGFFNAIQALKDKESCKDVDALVGAVERAFWNQPKETLDNVFLSLQMVMQESLRVDGGNNYKLKHMGKAKLRKAGLCPTSINCDPELIIRGKKVLKDAEVAAAAEAAKEAAEAAEAAKKKLRKKAAPRKKAVPKKKAVAAKPTSGWKRKAAPVKSTNGQRKQ